MAVFRGYSGQFCVSVDETPAGFKWSVSDPKTEVIFTFGVAPTMPEALDDAYAALAHAFRNSTSEAANTEAGSQAAE
ncbi:MAG TPA: hypothetical protein VGM57_03650 [Pseudolabrys sp.]|jgi:hypothetical protein